MKQWLLPLYVVGDIATFVYLMFVDWDSFNWWNWLIIVPLNGIIASLWPIYWGLLHWVFR